MAESMIAKDGRAIIGGCVVPSAEVKVLRALVQLGGFGLVPQIALQLNEQLSDASIYTLLTRIEKRELASHEKVCLEALGRPVKRVKWTVSQKVIDFFTENDKKEAG